MAPIAPHMQRGFSQITRALAEVMPALRQAQGNLRYAADLIAYNQRKKK